MTAPRKNLLPDPSPEEYDALKKSIAERGFWQANPIVVDENGDILDGFTRSKVCKELGIDPPKVVVEGLTDWQKIEYAMGANINRRHLSIAMRRQLLKRLTELYDTELRKAGEAARKAGNAKGGSAKPKSSVNETKLDAPTKEARSRTAAADASQTRFDEPVVAGSPPKADRLETLGKMVGVSRATVARDEQILNRMETIEKEARRQKRDDVLRLLDASRPNLDELERAVGLREPLPEVEKPDADRAGWVSNLAQALNNLAPALTDAEADALYAKLASQDTASIQLGQLRGAVAAARKRAGG